MKVTLLLHTNPSSPNNNSQFSSWKEILMFGLLAPVACQLYDALAGGGNQNSSRSSWSARAHEAVLCAVGFCCAALTSWSSLQRHDNISSKSWPQHKHSIMACGLQKLSDKVAPSLTCQELKLELLVQATMGESRTWPYCALLGRLSFLCSFRDSNSTKEHLLGSRFHFAWMPWKYILRMEMDGRHVQRLVSKCSLRKAFAQWKHLLWWCLTFPDSSFSFLWLSFFSFSRLWVSSLSPTLFCI